MCLKALTWCYSKYSSKISWGVQQMEAILYLLSRYAIGCYDIIVIGNTVFAREDRTVVDQTLLLLQEIFIVAGNIQVYFLLFLFITFF